MIEEGEDDLAFEGGASPGGLAPQKRVGVQIILELQNMIVKWKTFLVFKYFWKYFWIVYASLGHFY